MPSLMECYARLGVRPEASEAEIKAAYRDLARRFHPDVAPSESKQEAERAFKRVSEAYASILRGPSVSRRVSRGGTNDSEWRARKAASVAAEARKGGRVSLAVVLGILAIPCALGAFKISTARTNMEHVTWRKNGLLYPPVNPFLSEERASSVKKVRKSLIRDLLFPNR